MKHAIIALMGAKQAGKTTVYDILKQYVGAEHINEIQLAKKLKDACSKVFHIPRYIFDDNSLKESGLASDRYVTKQTLRDIFQEYSLGVPSSEDYDMYVNRDGLYTPRQILQYVGTNILRHKQRDIHITHAEIYADKLNVTTDVRFPNEFDYYKGLGAKMFFIENKRAEEEADKDLHESERHRNYLHDSADCIIDNNRSLDELRKQVVKKILGG